VKEETQYRQIVK